MAPDSGRWHSEKKTNALFAKNPKQPAAFIGNEGSFQPSLFSRLKQTILQSFAPLKVFFLPFYRLPLFSINCCKDISFQKPLNLFHGLFRKRSFLSGVCANNPAC